MTAALNDLQEAISSKEAFLEEAELTEAGITGATGVVATADEAVAVFEYATKDGSTAVYAVGDSERVKEASVADARDQLALNLKAAQADLAEKQEAVAEVQGLASAINLYNNRSDALESALKDQTVAQAAEDGALANYNGLNADVTIVNNEVTGVIELDGDKLVLADKVTEQSNPGVTALLSAIQSRAAANEAVTQATGALNDAVINIGYIDYEAAGLGDSDKKAIGAAFETEITDQAKADAITRAQVQAELNTLKGNAANELVEGAVLTFDAATGLITNDATDFSDATGAEGSETSAVKDAFGALQVAVTSFEDGLVTAVDFVNAPLTDAQVEAQGFVASAEQKIVDLEELLTDLAEVLALAGTLESLNDDIEAAEAAFEDLGVELPVSLDGNVVGTAEDDLFLAGTTDANVFNFGAQGEDKIFFGADYSLVQIPEDKAITDKVGDVAALEILWAQEGNNLVLYVEQETFAGNGSTEADIATITLSGVSAEDVSFADGYLSVA